MNVCAYNERISRDPSRMRKEALMELIVINQSKIKIMLTPPDMQRYAFSASASCPAPGPGLRRLLADIRDRCGVELCEERLMVDLYTSEAGCELFLTGLGPREPLCFDDGLHHATTDASITESAPDGSNDRKTTVHSTVAPPCKTAALPRDDSRKNAPNGLTEAEAALLDRIRATEDVREDVRAFATLDDLLRLCRRISATGFAGRSDVYIEDAPHRFYLWLTFPDGHDARCAFGDRFAFLSEYAPTVDIDLARLCKGEYWRPIALRNAADVLGELV